MPQGAGKDIKQNKQANAGNQKRFRRLAEEQESVKGNRLPEVQEIIIGQEIDLELD